MCPHVHKSVVDHVSNVMAALFFFGSSTKTQVNVFVFRPLQELSQDACYHHTNIIFCRVDCFVRSPIA
jgi:hypothetical protein